MSDMYRVGTQFFDTMAEALDHEKALRDSDGIFRAIEKVEPECWCDAPCWCMGSEANRCRACVTCGL